MKNIFIAVSLVCIALGSFSCDGDDEKENNKPNLSVEPKTLTFTDQEQTQDVVITTNQESWDAVSNQTWCTITKGTDKFTVAAAANTTIDERTATITVSAGNAANVTIEVKQSGTAHTLSVTPNEPISFTKNGGASDAKTITVSTNVSTWNAVSDQTWCTVTKGTNQFTVTASALTGNESRSASITVSAGKASNVTVKVTQVSEPVIEFRAGNPALELIYNGSFFKYSRINFILVVIDDAGYTSITINEKFNTMYYDQQYRDIPISGPGSYPVVQEISSALPDVADINKSFTYRVSAHGVEYSTNFWGLWSSYSTRHQLQFNILGTKPL